jgi:uncharacterized phage protein (predicted DNA packaging)
MLVTIKELKRNLNIEFDYLSDDILLQNFILTSEAITESYLNYSLSGYTSSGETATPIQIKQAIIMLASHFYINRNIVAFTSVSKMPYTYDFILNSIKEFTII